LSTNAGVVLPAGGVVSDGGVGAGVAGVSAGVAACDDGVAGSTGALGGGLALHAASSVIVPSRMSLRMRFSSNGEAAP
jgi:hypothetical protein